MTTQRPPSATCLITDFGARGDGVTLDTVAIQMAIDRAALHGGTAVVPPGLFLTGTLFLKSNVTLYLAPGARLLGSGNLKDYPAQTWGHHKDRTPYHLIMARNAERITIRGEGEIDGNGACFWQSHRDSDWHFWRECTLRPSPMVEITGCRDVRIEGIRLTGSAGWTLHLHDTDRAQIRGLTILNTLFGPNTDGIDLTGCHEVTISDCHISTGDDAIALKTTRDSRDCRNITVTNCVLETNCVALRVGFESRRDFRYLTFSNCVIRNCSRAIGLLATEGGDIEHVAFSNIVGVNNSGWPFNRAIEIDANRIDDMCGMCPEHPDHGRSFPTDKPSSIRHISFNQIDLVTDGRVLIGAARGGEVRDLVFSGLRLKYPMIDDPGPLGKSLEGRYGFFSGMPELREARAAFAAWKVSGLVLRDFTVEWPTYPVPDDWNLLKSPQRFINSPYLKGQEERIRKGEGVPPFHAFWGRDLRESCLDLRRVRSSSPDVRPWVVEGTDLTLET